MQLFCPKFLRPSTVTILPPTQPKSIFGPGTPMVWTVVGKKLNQFITRLEACIAPPTTTTSMVCIMAMILLATIISEHIGAMLVKHWRSKLSVVFVRQM